MPRKLGRRTIVRCLNPVIPVFRRSNPDDTTKAQRKIYSYVRGTSTRDCATLEKEVVPLAQLISIQFYD